MGSRGWLERRPLLPDSKVAHELRVGSFERDGLFCEVVVVAFRGRYRPGSEGAPDAELMRAVTAAALARFGPDVVVLDLSELDYVWGDTLLRVLEVIEGWDAEHPVGGVVVRSERSAGLDTLLPAGVLAGSAKEALERAEAIALDRARAIG